MLRRASLYRQRIGPLHQRQHHPAAAQAGTPHRHRHLDGLRCVGAAAGRLAVLADRRQPVIDHAGVRQVLRFARQPSSAPPDHPPWAATGRHGLHPATAPPASPAPSAGCRPGSALCPCCRSARCPSGRNPHQPASARTASRKSRAPPPAAPPGASAAATASGGGRC
jgi:hypothetical protein